jgi:orotidine-5'-phosphate decarboxylase
VQRNGLQDNCDNVINQGGDVQAKDRIIVALDVDSADRAISLVERLRDEVGVFKVGLELLMAAGPPVVRRIQAAGATKVFLDAKLHDIPNTVQGAMRGIVELGVWCVTLHTTGGAAMLRAAAETAKTESATTQVARPLLLGVTVLTSLPAQALQDELGVDREMSDHVGFLAKLAHRSCCDGVIASPMEIETVRRAVPDPKFMIITPGVRPIGSSAGDQVRVLTPAEAVRRGADYLVIGRPIVAASDPVDAARRIAAEIEQTND